jgi:Ulp1 family protease
MWRLVVDIADEFGLDIAADWERSNVINKPIQNNDYDCGILTIMYTEHLVAGIPTSNIKEFYCSRYRFKIANSILNGEIEFNERGLNNYNNNLW